MALARFLIRRVLSGIIVLWVVSSLAFFLFFAHNTQFVARQLAGRAATTAVLGEVSRNLGLNQPILVQYWHFIYRTLHGNLGKSYYSGGTPVISIVARDLPRTASVLAGGVVLWLLVGLAVGILSATRARSIFDRMSTVGVLVGLSLPTFVLGEILLLVIYLPLNQSGYHWLNTGYVPLSQGFGGWAGAMLLPWVTLATVQAAVYTRLSRGSLLDTLGEDYIRTARAKGLSERRVVYRHALRGALTPVVSQLGIDIGTLLGGVVVVEQVFGVSGFGQDAVSAIANGDLPTILAFVLFAATFVVVANIIVDMLYAVLDPRVRIS
ncbi:MAG TPA: ABC transporter permease [Streptosporangiaceae bacterium]|nr:ABC transporter permease [Streptosporangiaceae bacterium]